MFLPRTFRLILGLVLGLWLAAMVPAHRLLDELLDRHADAPAADAGVASSRDAQPLPSDAPNPHGHDDAHCAVCLYATSLTVATPQTVAIAPPELRAIRGERAPPGAVVATLPTPIRGRAPPAC